MSEETTNTTSNATSPKPETFLSDADLREHTIDAAGKRLGKVATEAATVLQGKDKATYAKHIMENVHVTIINAAKLDITEKRLTDVYQRYSGYPGGLTKETLGHLKERRGIAAALRISIGGMLPQNKHKKRLLNQLTITE